MGRGDLAPFAVRGAGKGSLRGPPTRDRLTQEHVTAAAGIHVHASNYGAQASETTKSEAGERFVPLFGSPRTALAETKLRSRFNRDADLVFTTAVGTPLDPGNFVRREFKPALERAGLRAFRFHDLRHFAVSALIAEGADIKLLQAIAGHASATMTLDHYGHLMTARVSEAAVRYDPLVAATSQIGAN